MENRGRLRCDNDCQSAIQSQLLESPLHKCLPLIVVFVLVLMAGPVFSEIPGGIESAELVRSDGDDDRLSTTLLGKLEPGGEPRLAVRWDGPAGVMLDVWVDFDGDGAVGSEELVIADRPLEPGIEVVNLEISAELFDVSQPRLSVRARVPYLSDHNQPPQKDVSASDQAGCGWQPGFFLDDFDSGVNDFAVFDDGAGPALFVGGWFITAGGVTVNRIAKWDGAQWSALNGSSGTGVNHYVAALAVYDDGLGEALYVGGGFVSAGGVVGRYIAKWDGLEWSAVGHPSDFAAPVLTLAVYDDGSGPGLYAGGEFLNYIQKWDGNEWSQLLGPSYAGTNDVVFALTVYDDGSGPALAVGGRFTEAGGVTVNGIALWDGAEWSALDGPSWPGVLGRVEALAIYDDGTGPALYVGGGFVLAGNITVNSIAKWDGSEWFALSGSSGTGAYPRVYALTAYDDGTGPALYVGGDFSTAGGVTVSSIAKWNGSEWSALAGSSGTGVNSAVDALIAFDDGTGPALYVGGWFTTAGGVSANRIAKWVRDCLIFFDSFETGDTGGWSVTQP